MALVVLGGLFALLLRSPFKKTWKWFLNRAPLIKRYWLFVVPFFIGVIIVYYLLYKYSLSEQLGNNLSIAGQLIALIFAIFVGYLAFLQVNISRVDALKSSAREELKDGAYPRAVKLYEELFSINSKDFYALSELLEVYLIQKDHVSFSEKIDFLRKNSLSDKEKKVVLYLEFSFQLFQSGPEAATTKAEEMVTKFSKTQKNIFWDFDDIKKSDMYKNLQTPTRIMFENFTRYMDGTLQLDLLEKFERGEYCASEGASF